MKPPRGRSLGPLVLGAALAVAAAIALAAGRGPDPGAVPAPDDVYRRIMSPFCPGLTLEECPSSQAAELRGRIAANVAEGWTNRRLDAWLVDTYGESALGRPRTPAVWLAPAAGLLAGALLLVAGLRRRRAAPAPEEPPPPLPAGDRARLQAELAAFRDGGTE